MNGGGLTLWQVCGTCHGATTGVAYDPHTGDRSTVPCHRCKGQGGFSRRVTVLDGLLVRFAAPVGRRVIITGRIEHIYRMGDVLRATVRATYPEQWAGRPVPVDFDNLELVDGGK